ncbi:MAG: hypothetical protein DMG07_21525 [Acidobacteria bacterium]|nr:MAG: hypothetical protein DMG07_21525 [Acidobacteriota bacterium]
MVTTGRSIRWPTAQASSRSTPRLSSSHFRNRARSPSSSAVMRAASSRSSATCASISTLRRSRAARRVSIFWRANASNASSAWSRAITSLTTSSTGTLSRASRLRTAVCAVLTSSLRIASVRSTALRRSASQPCAGARMPAASKTLAKLTESSAGKSASARISSELRSVWSSESVTVRVSILAGFEGAAGVTSTMPSRSLTARRSSSRLIR